MGVILDKLKQFPARFRGVKGKNIVEAASFLEAKWKEALNVGGTRENPAPPGQCPHRVSGGLRAKVKVVANAWLMRLEMHHGSPVAMWQNDGTKRMRARPHREVTFQKNKAQVWEILGRR